MQRAYLGIVKVEEMPGETKAEYERALSLAGRTVLRALLMEHFGLSYDSLRIEKGEAGKPYFADCPGVHFNISHSGNYAACVVSSVNVGLDIQIHRKTDSTRLAERLFPPEMQDCPEPFFDRWARLESYAKWRGCGLRQRLAYPERGQFYPVFVAEGYSGMLYCEEPLLIEKEECFGPAD